MSLTDAVYMFKRFESGRPYEAIVLSIQNHIEAFERDLLRPFAEQRDVFHAERQKGAAIALRALLGMFSSIVKPSSREDGDDGSQQSE